MTYAEFTSRHLGPERRYRVTLTGALRVDYLRPGYGWRESVNCQTREIARRIREAHS